MLNNTLYKNVIDDINFGYWEMHNNSSRWSSGFIEQLGYSNEDVDMTVDFFLNNLIHEDYKDNFRDNFFSLVRNYLDFKQVIAIKCKNGKYKEFVCLTNDNLPIKAVDGSKVIYFNERKFKTNSKVKKNNFYYRESAEMTSTGSWYVDFEKQRSYWDDQTKKILEYPEDYIPSLKYVAEYYPEDDMKLAIKCFYDCSTTGKPFDVEIKMLTANRKEIWTKAIGKPVYNDSSEIVGMRGIFQDIDKEKIKSIELQKTADIIASQNSRLFNFAHIVSHNLRSHTSNLSLITQLIDDVETVDEKLEMLNSIKDISESLNTTIDHLNEVVTIQTQTDQNKVQVCFTTTLDLVKKSINRIIRETNTTINIDFSKLGCIDYIPAYLESIFLNLITNAIKYKHPERDPVISLTSYISNDEKYIEISDNGSGIDMDKFGDKLFGMYKTFHYNKDAVGIGLFITKNQVEALNGNISVESQLSLGTTFKIKF